MGNLKCIRCKTSEGVRNYKHVETEVFISSKRYRKTTKSIQVPVCYKCSDDFDRFINLRRIVLFVVSLNCLIAVLTLFALINREFVIAFILISYIIISSVLYSIFNSSESNIRNYVKISDIPPTAKIKLADKWLSLEDWLTLVSSPLHFKIGLEIEQTLGKLKPKRISYKKLCETFINKYVVPGYVSENEFSNIFEQTFLKLGLSKKIHTKKKEGDFLIRYKKDPSNIYTMDDFESFKKELKLTSFADMNHFDTSLPLFEEILRNIKVSRPQNLEANPAEMLRSKFKSKPPPIDTLALNNDIASINSRTSISKVKHIMEGFMFISMQGDIKGFGPLKPTFTKFMKKLVENGLLNKLDPKTNQDLTLLRKISKLK